jgi:hypothetical protein
MQPLIELVDNFTNMLDKPVEGSISVVFFHVGFPEELNANTVRPFLEGFLKGSVEGEFNSVTFFDGNEHSYTEIGAWIGDQGLALRLMALGAKLGLWKLLTPRVVLGKDIPDELEKRAAGAGYITIKHEPEAFEIPAGQEEVRAKYPWPGKAEISGFGGAYENACRTMLYAGMKFLDANPGVQIQIKELQGVFGIHEPANGPSKVLGEAIATAVPDCSGAMHHAVMRSLIYISMHGWTRYCESMGRSDMAAKAAKKKGADAEAPAADQG